MLARGSNWIKRFAFVPVPEIKIAAELLKEMQSDNDKIKDRLLPYETKTSSKYKDQGSVGDGLTPKQIIM